MFVFYFILFCLLLIVIFWYKRPPENPVFKTQLLTEKQENITLKDLKDNVVLVSYFQSWCGDCRRELPEITALQKVAGGSDFLKIILISDESWDKINIVKNIANNPDILFLQSQESLKSIGIRRFPTTYLLDKDGKAMKAETEGIYWNTSENIQLINQLNQQE